MGESAEILFENRFAQTEEITREVFFDHYYRRSFYVVADILLLGMFFVNLFVGPGESLFGKFFPLLLAGVFWGYKFQGYRSAVHGTAERNRRVPGGELVSCVTATKKGLVYTDNAGSHDALDFGDILRVRSTRRCIVLQSAAGILYVCRKDAFTLGSAEGFLSLLREKKVRGA